MSMGFKATIGTSLLGLALLGGCELPPQNTAQQGFRGTGMVAVSSPETDAMRQAANQAPAPEPAAAAGSPAASTIYKNVPQLGHLNVAEFTRVMVAMTNWVSPEQGCNYCHDGANFESDKLYTKVVARRMLEMTRDINSQWKTHVGDTGVTCYTCHRGKPVPSEVWFQSPEPRQAAGLVARRGHQNAPAPEVGLTSLQYDPFERYLSATPAAIRVVSTQALPNEPGKTIQATEGTYGLMMHLSQALGVNCTHCHNSRSFAEWDPSSPGPKRVTAWHGLNMVRQLNVEYLSPLKATFPASRLGPHGDAPKANCATCHQGAPKPLAGAAMIKDYPELISKPSAAPAAAPTPAEAAAAPAAAEPAPTK